MALLWQQNTFPGVNGTLISTLTPGTPGGASYVCSEGHTVTDGNNFCYRNLATALFDDTTLTGFVFPASKKINWSDDVWYVGNSVFTYDVILYQDAANLIQVRITQVDATHAAMDIYSTIATTVFNQQVATNIAVTASNTQATSTVNRSIDIDWSTAGSVTITVNVGVNGGAKSLLFTKTFSMTIAPTAVKFRMYQGNANVRMSNLQINSIGGVMTVSPDVGDIACTGTASATCLAPAPSGGGGSYTYQWYRDVVANFTLGAGNLLAGQTAQLYNKSDHVAGTLYYLACRISDGTTTIDTNRRRFRLSGLAPLVVGFVGDSTFTVADGVTIPASNADNAPFYFKLAMQTILGLRGVTVINMAVAGSATAQWLTGQANMIAALAAFAGAPIPPQYVFLNLGVNDAQTGVSGATFTTNYANIVAALTGPGYKVLCNLPGPRNSGNDFEQIGTFFTDDYYTLLDAYSPVIKASVNGTTVFAGDYTSQDVLGARSAELGHNSSVYPGWVHPLHQGAATMGINMMYALKAVTNPIVPARAHKLRGGRIGDGQ